MICDDSKMRSHVKLTAVAVAVAAAAILPLSVPAATAAAAPAARWHVTGLASAPGSSGGILAAVACTGGARCVAGGSYYVKTAFSQDAMIVAESSGKWGSERALRLPAGALAEDQRATIASVSCPAATSCVAVGSDATKAGLGGFMATGHGSKWGRAFSPAWPKGTIEPPVGYLTGVSCTSRGTCVAVGGYTNAAGNGEPMVVAESRGHWGRAVAIRLPANAVANPNAHLTAVSCPAAGDCVAVGIYTIKDNQGEALAATEVKGRWKRASEILLPPVTVEPFAVLYSVSCAKPGACVAVGSYVTGSATDALAVAESGGRWRRGVGLTALPSGAVQGGSASADLNGVSCSASECLAVGDYLDEQGGDLSMAITEARGKWSRGVRVGPPAHAATGSAQSADLFAVACRSRGPCTAVGDYTATSHVLEAMVATSGK
jgi:hypothetical protein